VPHRCPAAVPQAPLHTLQAKNCLVGKTRVARTRADAARRLQRMLEAHISEPPVQHDRDPRQRLALTAVTARHHHRTAPSPVCPRARRPQRARARTLRPSRAIAGESEAVLATIGVDHLAREHLEMARSLSLSLSLSLGLRRFHHSNPSVLCVLARPGKAPRSRRSSWSPGQKTAATRRPK
jgi:hypothetical protein